MSNGRYSFSTTHAFYQNDALLFQFVLHELMITQQKIQKDCQESLLNQLIGESIPYDIQFPLFKGAMGSLKKLYFYFSILKIRNNEKTRQNAFKEMAEFSEDAIKKAENCRYFLKSNQEESAKCFEVIKDFLNLISKCVFSEILYFHENENILYFLLRNQIEIDSLFGSRLVATTFERLGGIQETCQVILDKYSLRGFHHLLPFILQQSEVLQSQYL
jgi:hypothetical protein